jgi:hypothetical protein
MFNYNDHIDEEMGGACSTNGESKTAYKLLVGKPGAGETTRKVKV